MTSPPRLAPSSDAAALARLKRDAAGCRDDLWKRATQTVFGAGLVDAAMMLVGEQPGNEEDLQGAPFVGPAGRVLDRALEEASIDRDQVYITNVVKHFKWIEASGDKRIHKKPSISEQHACRVWLDAEMRLVKPRIVICLGATAAQALLGSKVSVLRDREEIFHPGFAPLATVTIHPSSILRTRSDQERHAARAAFTADLRRAARSVE